MSEFSDHLAHPFHIQKGWRAAGFAAFAGLFLAAAGASPASAQSSSNPGCNFSAAPQGYGDSMRYANCMHQLDCQQLANAAAATIYAAGCFGVAPDGRAGQALPEPRRR